MAHVASYAYSKSDGAVCVNLYGGSTLTTKLPDGQTVKLAQETDYPWNGRVRLTIEDCGSAAFALKLRIPGWAKSASIRLNGALSGLSPSPATYFVPYYTWANRGKSEMTVWLPLGSQSAR